MKKTILGYALGLAAIAAIAYANPNQPQPSVGLYWTTATDPTGGTGVAAPLWQLLIRTDTSQLYYKSGTANTAWTSLSGGGGGGGVSSITCTANEGLLCTPNPITGVGTIGIAQLVTIQNETIVTGVGGTLNNWDPWASGPHTTRVEIDPNTAATTITGIVAGNDGDLLWLWNGGNGGTNPNIVTLPSQSGSSSALNRFWIANGKLVNIPNNDGVLLIYDGAFGWTCFSCATSILRAQELSTEAPAIATALASGSSTNDYNPWSVAGIGTSSYVRQDVSGSGTATITGIVAAGAPNSEGRIVIWNNISTAGSTAFLNASGSSAGPNEILTPGAATYTIGPGASVFFIYDDTVEMWRLIGPAPLSATGVTGSGTTNQTTKWTSATAVGDGWATDDGTSWGKSGAILITEATGAISMVGGITMGGNISVGGDVVLDSGTDTFLIVNDDIGGAGNQNMNISAAGTGVIRFNGNQGSITNSGTGGVQFYPGANSSTPSYTIAASHLVSTGAAAGLSCNGTGGVTCSTAVCDDIAGTIVANTGATSCTVTFAATYATGPTCVVSAGSATTTPIYISTRNALAITITTSGTLPGLIDYQCTGHS